MREDLARRIALAMIEIPGVREPVAGFPATDAELALATRDRWRIMRRFRALMDAAPREDQDEPHYHRAVILAHLEFLLGLPDT